MPRLATDEQGKANIPLPPTSAPVTVRLWVEGQGKGRTGSAEIEMRLLPRQ
jgi:hypothetical protein